MKPPNPNSANIELPRQNAASSLSLPKKLLFSLIILLLFLLFLELVLRGFFLLTGGSAHGAKQLSDEFGWVTTANFHSGAKLKGFGPVDYSTTQYGFRVFGDLDTTKTRIFVIGDSQTQARHVSDGETYFDYIKNNAEVEIFAYGGGGYGTLQEFMILDKYLDQIEPDLILWQFCINDLFNNSFTLEANSRHNNHMTRPYYESGGIVYRYPHSSWLYRNLLRHSYLVRFTGLRLDIFMASFFPESKLKPTLQSPLYLEAFATTSSLLGLVKGRASGRPVIAFSACGNQNSPFSLEFARISKQNGIDYIEGIPGAVWTAGKSGEKVDGSPHDRHWNGRGHQIAGQIILAHLLNRGLVTSRDDAITTVPARDSPTQADP